MRDEVLSKKKKELLAIIDKYGIVTRKQIDEFMAIGYRNKVESLKKLEDLDFIRTYRLAEGYVHYITKRGSEYIGLNNRGYTAGKKDPNLAILVHNLRVNDCIINEIKEKSADEEITDLVVISEREILTDLYLNVDMHFDKERRSAEKMRQMNRIPDFILKFVVNEERSMKNAYEVELSNKGKTALERKLRWYVDERLKQRVNNVVYYYEDESIKNRVANKGKDVGLSLFFKKIN